MLQPAQAIARIHRQPINLIDPTEKKRVIVFSAKAELTPNYTAGQSVSLGHRRKFRFFI